MTGLVYTIAERRICWPTPDATCLHGGCGYCNFEPYRKLSTIERYARKAGVLPHRGRGEEDALHAFQHGLAHEFYGAETRTSRANLVAYAETVGALALSKMAEGMPGGSHARKKAETIPWLLRYRRDVLDESFRRTWHASRVIREEVR